MKIDELVRAAVGGAYEMPDGRKFWIDDPVAREISRRVQAAIQKQERSFPAILAAMTDSMESHPWWKMRVEGTPLENDLPVRATTAALEYLRMSDLLCD